MWTLTHTIIPFFKIPWFEAKKLGTNTRTEHCDEYPLDYITDTQ